LEAIANEREPNPAGATRAMEPVFEEMAREMHMRLLVRVSPLSLVTSTRA
jgi:hypothetical protein